MPYHYRQADEQDLEGVARVFATAFPESIEHYFGRRTPHPRAVAEPFRLCLAAEPEAFWVADAGGAVAGYIFAPSRTNRLPWVALSRGFVFHWLWRWVTGQLGIGLAPVRGLAANKLDFLASARQPRVRAEARILSVAVHPDHRGRGIAGTLCALALQRLDRLHATPVRLEVRPTNAPAMAVYTKLGFRPVGRTQDSQGEWLIMLRENVPGTGSGSAPIPVLGASIGKSKYGEEAASCPKPYT